LSAVNKGLAGCRKDQGALIRHQKTSASQLRTQLDAVCSTLTQQIATIGLRETEHNDIIFEGENLDAIALPLMLMQTDLAKALRTLATQGAVKVSLSEARWIQEEMEKLLICGNESAALAARSRSLKAHTRSTKPFAEAFPTRNTSYRTASSQNSCGVQHNLHALVSKFKTETATSNDTDFIPLPECLSLSPVPMMHWIKRMTNIHHRYYHSGYLFFLNLIYLQSA
jgi:hypothetical protein